MGVRMGVFSLAMLAYAMAGAALNGAVAQQPPPKPGVTVPQPDEAAAGDAFMPPLRGTPDGRISGGTRGLPHPPGSSGASSGQMPQPVPVVPVLGAAPPSPPPGAH